MRPRLADDAIFAEAVALMSDLPSEASKRVALAALKLFSRAGFHTTTTRDISNEAQVSAGALYTYFSSKEDILYRWMLAGHSAVLSLAQDALRSNVRSPEESVYGVVYEISKWHAVHWILSRVIGLRLADLSSEHYEVIYGLRLQIEDCLRDPIEDGQDSGVFSVTDSTVLLNAIFALMLDVSRWFRRHDIAADDLADRYGRLALAMLKAGI